MKDIQAKHNREPLVPKFQSEIAQLEAILNLYQRKEDPLKLAQQLQAVIGTVNEIRWDLLTQELTTVLHNEDLPAARRKEKVVRIFQLERGHLRGRQCFQPGR
jgi:DNA-binding FrmR family transcriptional regulator